MTGVRTPAEIVADLLTAAIDNRDLLDVIANDDDIPVYRRNEARQAVTDFDAALSGFDAL